MLLKRLQLGLIHVAVAMGIQQRLIPALQKFADVLADKAKRNVPRFRRLHSSVNWSRQGRRGAVRMGYRAAFAALD